MTREQVWRRASGKGDFCGDPWRENLRKEVIYAVLVCKKFRCVRSHIQDTTSSGIFTIDRVLPCSFIFDIEFLLKIYAKHLYHLIKAFSVVLASKDSTTESDQRNYSLFAIWLGHVYLTKTSLKSWNFMAKYFFLLSLFVFADMSSHYILCGLSIKSMTCPNRGPFLG